MDLRIETSRDKTMRNKNAITLVSLVITVIMLLIVAGITLYFVFGEDGVITRSQLARFSTEMKEIKENVNIKINSNAIDILAERANNEVFDEKVIDSELKDEFVDSLKCEVLFAREGFPENGSTADYDPTEFDTLLETEEGNYIYIINQETGNGKANTYIYDARTDIVFKIPPTSIGGKIYHCYETAVIAKGYLLEEEVK